MKKGKMKKLLVLMLSLVMLMSFAACGGGESEQTKNSESSNNGEKGFNDNEIDSNISNSKYKIGDYITFGKYEQDNDTSNGAEDIEWLVLDVKDGKALVISKYALDCKQYNTDYVDVTWETCSLRKWLNNEFINTAFSANEKEKISVVTVSADKNPSYSTNPGNATQDKVFLLSITEAYKYFSSDHSRECKPTDYAVANGAYVEDYGSYSGNCWWWLRSPGDIQTFATFVRYVGQVNENGDGIIIRNGAVRPAMWITIG